MELFITTYNQLDIFSKHILWIVGIFAILGLIKAVFSNIIEDTVFELIVEMIYTNTPIICFILFFAKMALASNGNIIAILCLGLGILLEALLLITFDIRNIKRWTISHTLKKKIEKCENLFLELKE
jgi:hypothetical protein